MYHVIDFNLIIVLMTQQPQTEMNTHGTLGMAAAEDEIAASILVSLRNSCQVRLD